MNDAYLNMSAAELAADPAVQALVLEGREAEAWSVFAAEHADFAARLATARAELTALVGHLEGGGTDGALDGEAQLVWRRIEARTKPRARAGMPRRSSSRRLRRFGVVAAAAAAAIALLVLFLPGTSPESYSTGPGELLAVELPDGSQVTLGPTSSLRVGSFSDLREVVLEGEAYFDVERGGRFSVETPNGRVSVLGTSFTVDALDAELGVACATGRVAVVAAGDSVVLVPGRAARVTQLGIDTFGVQVAAIGSWRDGVLRFDNEPLQQVAAELARYYDRPASVSDASRDRRITAELPAGDLALAVERLEFLLQSSVDTAGGALRFN